MGAAIFTYPSQEDLVMYEQKACDYMHPNRQPFAVVAEGFVAKKDCESISAELNLRQPYKHDRCGALTREIHGDPSLSFIEKFGHYINSMYWQYDLDEPCVTWMQTYAEGGDYDLHADADPGRMRKMTAVVLLTDPNDYDGGDLSIYWYPAQWRVPRTQGTIVCFQPWILHDVSKVTRGVRQSLNVSYWGPNFK